MLCDLPHFLICQDRVSIRDGISYALGLFHPLLGRPEYLISTLHGVCTLNDLCLGMSQGWGCVCAWVGSRVSGGRGGSCWTEIGGVPLCLSYILPGPSGGCLKPCCCLDTSFLIWFNNPCGTRVLFALFLCACKFLLYAPFLIFFLLILSSDSCCLYSLFGHYDSSSLHPPGILTRALALYAHPPSSSTRAVVLYAHPPSSSARAVVLYAHPPSFSARAVVLFVHHHL